MWTRNRDAWNPLRRAGAFFSGRIFFGLLLFWATAAPWAADNLPFGPQSFERGPGKPERIFLTFPADDLQTGHALFLHNGAQEEPEKVAGRVSSAKITLNGELIVGPRDLNRQIGFLKVPVTLESENELSVELRGSHGGYLTLEIGRTDNHRPVADAGPDQTVALGETAWLDGSSSHDLDGDRISYQWRLTGLPELSLTDLSETNAVVPSFEVDVPGDYLAELIVNDGERDSEPAQVRISTYNSAPVANAGPDRTMAVGETAVLDGGASYDADDDRLSYSWALRSIPEQSQASLRHDNTPYPELDLDLPGDYLVRLIVSDGLYDSDPDDSLVSTENSRPVADAGPDQVLKLGEAAVLDASGSSDADGDALTYDWALLYAPGGSLAGLTTSQTLRAGLIPDLAGDYVAQVIVGDGLLASDPDTVRLMVETIVNTPPIITSSPDTRATVGEAWQYLLSADDPDGDPLVYALVLAPAGMTIDSTSGEVGWVPDATGDFNVAVRVSDGRGGEADQTFTVAVADSATGGLPPDPASIAPSLDPTVITPFAIANEFLYTGPDPIQTGVGEGTIEPRRAAVIRGRVLDRAGNPLPGVSLSIKDHPELGQTQSREDGWFDLAVNGGGLLTLNYQKEGYLIAQRQVQTSWQDYAFADEVVLIPLDSRNTVINLADTSLGMQVARGSVSEDEDGARQATILFPEGTTAKMVLPDGTEQPLTSLSVRTTEYTVGANGPQTMPAPLPPTSGYTYAVELSVDEAIAHGAKRVELSRPLPIYVDNFIGFPTGEIVPVGWYDFDEATWIPAPNGRVIEILREDNGLAVLAVSGEGLDATPEDLEGLGIDEVERQMLAELYEPGTSLWRVLVDHFSPWDCNWPYGPPDDAELPPDRGPKNPDEGSPDRDCKAQGCVIGVESQVLGEDVSIIGTPYSIHYRSDRVLGRKAKNVLKIPLSDSTLPASLKRIELTIQIAGRRVEHSFLPAPDLTYTWTWDGLDAFGRSVTGANTARVEIKYVYGAAYYSAPSDFDASFAHLGASSSATGGQLSIVGQRQALEVGIAKTWSKTLGAFSSDAAGLGAWSLSVHHAYDPVGRILYRGDGRRRSAISIGRVITTPAGNGDSDYLGDAPPYGDGGPAIDAVISPTDVELAPDGSLYIADSNSGRIRRGDLDGVITNVAGTYPGGDYGDGGPATEARLDRPHGIAFGPDGSLYIADTYNHRIRRVGPDGMISTVAGTGDSSYRGDGGPATQTTLDFPRDVAVAPDGSLYIADTRNNRIRRVSTDGIISTVAGAGYPGYGGDGGPAIEAGLSSPGGLAVAPDGSLYIADTYNHRIRRVGTDGIITTVAGTYYRGYFGDGGPAIEAGLNHPEGVTVGPDGSLYIADTLNQRIRRVGPDGIIRTLAGTGEIGYDGDERPATGAMLNYPSGVAVDFDGNLYVADWFNLRVRRVGAAFPGVTARPLRNTVHAFAAKQQH